MYVYMYVIWLEISRPYIVTRFVCIKQGYIVYKVRLSPSVICLLIYYRVHTIYKIPSYFLYFYLLLPPRDKKNVLPSLSYDILCYKYISIFLCSFGRYDYFLTRRSITFVYVSRAPSPHELRILPVTSVTQTSFHSFYFLPSSLSLSLSSQNASIFRNIGYHFRNRKWVWTDFPDRPKCRYGGTCTG